MRLDHIAYRVADRHKTVNFFIEAFGYKVQTEFEIKFDDGATAKCFALEPPEKTRPTNVLGDIPWTCTGFGIPKTWGHTDPIEQMKSEEANKIDYHLAPEIFVSDGDPNSVVGRWVAKRDGIGGIHHLAYQVESVQAQMDIWKEKGYAEFTTENPLTCPGLVQVFTKPSELTGVIYEFIERGVHGFCQDNVKQLMISTDSLS